MRGSERSSGGLACRRAALAVVAIAALAVAVTDGATPKFFNDDPIAREPESQDASGAKPWDIGLLYDLSLNLFATASRPPSGLRAANINTIDEVPDSSWFTNRIDRGLSEEALLNGVHTGPAPNPAKWTVIREKSSGFAPGFTAVDAVGETWFISFDPPGFPESATGAIVIAHRFFWALGYNQVENYLTTVDPKVLTIDPKAVTKRPSGARTPTTSDDIDAILRRAAPGADGTYRAAAGRLIRGTVLGGFRYEGTRPDDPNDLVAHEHRRELRALRVFGAWTNLTDLKAGNTLDAVQPGPGGHAIVRHFLQDVGSTFGVGANGPHDWDEGWEYFYQTNTTKRRLYTFGFALSPWQTATYEEYPAVGRFEGERFDPLTWRPHAPTTAYVEMRDDDGFWAARRVMAFTDTQIRAIVATGGISDPAAARHLADVMIARRNAIGRAYLTRVMPMVDPVLDNDGTLRFANAAESAGFAQAPTGYQARWFAFDNATGESRALGETQASTPVVKAPTGLSGQAGAFVRVDVSAESAAFPAWREPARLYFKRTGQGWTLVGLERLPDVWPAPKGGAAKGNEGRK